MKKSLASLLILLLTTSSSFAAQNKLQLSLKEAVRMALEKNLDIRAEFYNPAMGEADIKKSRAIYDTHLTFETLYQDATTYSTALGSSYDRSSFSVTPGVIQLLPTGGTIALKYDNIYQDNSITPPKRWSSSLGLSLNQPLLKNFGKDATELNIRLSEVSKESSLSHLKTRILTVIAQVRNEYFKLVAYREDYESRKASLELAQKVLVDTNARIKAGVLPAMELLNANFGVSSREKDLIDAEKLVSDQIDLLAQLIQAGSGIEINTVDKMDRGQIVIDDAAALKKALLSRPELEELQYQLKGYDLQTAVASKQTEPTLNMVTSVGLTGTDRDFNRNSERLGSMKYPAWSIGLQFDYPLGNQAAESDYIKYRLKSEQSRTMLENQRSLIENELRAAIRGVFTSYKQLDVADRARLYADERVKAYMKKVEVGLATTKDLLDVENDLVAARTNQIKAEVLYANSLTQYWKSTGELLEKERVIIDSSRSDALYRDVK